MKAHDPMRPPRHAATGREAVRWSALSVITRQVSQMAAALLIARILGPTAFGVVSAATVYVTLSTLILDQGLAAALVQRPDLNRRTPGAVASLNIVAGVILAAGTWFLAPAIGDFFRRDELGDLLRVLGLGLMVKSLAITPRAMLLRGLRYKAIAAADILAGLAGAAVGVVAALNGQGYWSVAWQVVTTDVVIAAVLLASWRVMPNLAFGELRAVLPFGLRIFGVSSLAYLSRNADNILVGRYLGVTSLSYYAMAYRVLVIPVQMIGQTVNQVVFPTFARMAHDRPAISRNLVSALELLSMAAVPPMLFAAASAPEIVDVVLGPRWAPAGPVLAVLAVAGARETVFYITGSVMRAMGAGRMNLRYELLATGTQLTGIVIGLQFGVEGVALGYAIAGFLLVPVLLRIQRSLTGTPVRRQLAAIVPSFSGSLAGVAAYSLLRLADLPSIVLLIAGAFVYALAFLAVTWLFHRAALRRSVSMALGIAGRA
jgi:O-antigen/teichoic acid export membrane protein